MIKVNVKLFAPLTQYVSSYDRGKGIDVEMEDGSVIQDLPRVLGLPEKEAMVVIVNGMSKKMTDLLSDLDQVKMFTPIGGG